MYVIVSYTKGSKHESHLLQCEGRVDGFPSIAPLEIGQEIHFTSSGAHWGIGEVWHSLIHNIRIIIKNTIWSNIGRCHNSSNNNNNSGGCFNSGIGGGGVYAWRHSMDLDTAQDTWLLVPRNTWLWHTGQKILSYGIGMPHYCRWKQRPALPASTVSLT